MAQIATQGFAPADALVVLAVAKAFHPPIDIGEASVAAWTAALNAGGVTNVEDAKAAVTRYFANPDNRDPWIKPWAVVEGVRAIRRERLRNGPGLAELSADLDPDSPYWTRIVHARQDAIADGRPMPMIPRQYLVGGAE
jgi:hypothetical protein